MRRIGIYPGTFDPVHPGHITFALETAAICQLDTVWFLPERNPRGKNASSYEHRVALLRHAAADTRGLRIVELASPRFTVMETLPEIHKLAAGASLTLLAGSDIIRTFPYRWEGLQTLLGDMSLAVGIRTGDKKDEIDQIIQELQNDYDTPIARTYIHTPDADMASTHIRNGSADTSRLHPETVRYMRTHHLYKQL